MKQLSPHIVHKFFHSKSFKDSFLFLALAFIFSALVIYISYQVYPAYLASQVAKSSEEFISEEFDYLNKAIQELVQDPELIRAVAEENTSELQK